MAACVNCPAGILNRIDETILFKPVMLEEITTTVNFLVAGLNKRFADRRVCGGSLATRTP